MTQVSFHGIGRSSPPSIETCQPCIRSTLSGIQSVYSVRDLTGLYLRAEPWRSEANRVRGLVHKLRLAATPPHPDSFAALRYARNPTSPRTWGEVEFVARPVVTHSLRALADGDAAAGGVHRLVG